MCLCVQTSKQSLPIESLWSAIQRHSYTAASLAEGDRADVGVSWDELRGSIMVTHLLLFPGATYQGCSSVCHFFLEYK